MFKVIAPIDTEGGGTYWLRCGTAFLNKDNSINVYLDAMPLKVKAGEAVKLQLREYTDEDRREREEKRAAYSARGTLATGLNPNLGNNIIASGQAGLSAADGVPF
jgi:hypothetical protein